MSNVIKLPTASKAAPAPAKRLGFDDWLETHDQDVALAAEELTLRALREAEIFARDPREVSKLAALLLAIAAEISRRDVAYAQQADLDDMAYRLLDAPRGLPRREYASDGPSAA